MVPRRSCFESARRLARGLEEKRVRPRGVTAQQSVLPVLDHRIFADVGKVAAHQREMMITVGLADAADTLEGGLVADVAAERVARVRGVDDHAARAQTLDRLADEAALR